MANSTVVLMADGPGSPRVLRMAFCSLVSISLTSVLATAHANEMSTSGRVLYLKFCASCHGLEGEGQTNWQKPNVLGELPAPPHNAQGHTWRHSDVDLFKMIADGWRDPFNRTDRLTMPPFKDILTQDQISEIVDYLKTFWSVEQREFQREQTSIHTMSMPKQGESSNPNTSKE